MASPRKVKRNALIVKLKNQGWTWRAIQKEFGFKSVSTVWEIVQNEKKHMNKLSTR